MVQQRETVIHPFPPHPDPLPQGEGTARIAHWKADNAGPFFAVGMVTLSPRERAGVRGNRPLPSANVLNLSCDRCPEGYIPTCPDGSGLVDSGLFRHSSFGFQPPTTPRTGAAAKDDRDYSLPPRSASASVRG